jgi:hypothetical protein
MRIPHLALPAALAAALLAACDGDEPTRACPAVLVPALEVTVVDAEDDSELTLGAHGWWVSSDYTDELVGSAFGGPLFAYGPAGRYGVIVQREGYQTWGRDDIRVAAGRCGPRTVEIVARLEPNAVATD